MDNWTYTEEIRSRLERRHVRRAGRPGSAERDVARMLAPWRRGRREGGEPDTVSRHG